MWHMGTTFMAVRCDLFVDRERFEQRASALGDRIRAIPPQRGVDRVRIPGDTEADALARSERDGIAIASTTWDALTAYANRMAVVVPT